MAENVYRFEFIDGTQSNDQSGITDVLGSGTSDKKTKSESKTFSQSFTKRVGDNVIQQTLISPLNTATGGLASPLYRTTKRLAGGSSMSTAFAGLAVAGVMIALQALQNRMKELEQKTENLNNADNALIRAGSVSKATYYTANIFGIKQKTDRS